MMKLNRLTLAVVCFLVVLGVSAARSEAQAQEARTWEGAWEWLHENNVGRLILLEDWFCGVFGARDRTAPPGALSQAVRARLFRTMSNPMCGATSVEFPPDSDPVLVSEAMFTARPQSAGGVARRSTRVEHDLMEGDLLRSDGTVRVTWRYRRLSSPGTGLLAGAWRLDSPGWDGLLVLTDSEYRFVVHRRDRSDLPRLAPRDLTEAQAAALYDAYDAEGGSYRQAGSSFARTPEVARDPRLQGQRLESELAIRGDTLILNVGDERERWVRVR